MALNSALAACMLAKPSSSHIPSSFAIGGPYSLACHANLGLSRKLGRVYTTGVLSRLKSLLL
jgi:hypothetical protein